MQRAPRGQGTDWTLLGDAWQAGGLECAYCYSVEKQLDLLGLEGSASVTYGQWSWGAAPRRHRQGFLRLRAGGNGVPHNTGYSQEGSQSTILGDLGFDSSLALEWHDPLPRVVDSFP